MPTGEKIALIGFGEAGSAFLTGWGLGGSGLVLACDTALCDPEGAGQAMAERCRAAGVAALSGPGDALATVSLVFSLVTADQALAAAECAAPHLAPGTLWLDGNSCSPGTKRAAAAAVEAAGGAYVDMAIMGPVASQRHRTPVLLAGPRAEDAAERVTALGMVPTVAGTRVGDASTVKMLRSVMVKGIEALTAEWALAARRAGVEDAVLSSLQASDPDVDWRARSAYNLERMMVHGARRAAEMREVAATLAELGLPARMSRASADWQDSIAALRLEAGPGELADRADRILAGLR